MLAWERRSHSGHEVRRAAPVGMTDNREEGFLDLERNATRTVFPSERHRLPRLYLTHPYESYRLI